MLGAAAFRYSPRLSVLRHLFCTSQANYWILSGPTGGVSGSDTPKNYHETRNVRPVGTYHKNHIWFRTIHTCHGIHELWAELVCGTPTGPRRYALNSQHLGSVLLLWKVPKYSSNPPRPFLEMPIVVRVVVSSDAPFYFEWNDNNIIFFLLLSKIPKSLCTFPGEQGTCANMKYVFVRMYASGLPYNGQYQVVNTTTSVCLYTLMVRVFWYSWIKVILGVDSYLTSCQTLTSSEEKYRVRAQFLSCKAFFKPSALLDLLFPINSLTAGRTLAILGVKDVQYTV